MKIGVTGTEKEKRGAVPSARRAGERWKEKKTRPSQKKEMGKRKRGKSSPSIPTLSSVVNFPGGREKRKTGEKGRIGEGQKNPLYLKRGQGGMKGLWPKVGRREGTASSHLLSPALTTEKRKEAVDERKKKKPPTFALPTNCHLFDRKEEGERKKGYTMDKAAGAKEKRWEETHLKTGKKKKKGKRGP